MAAVSIEQLAALSRGPGDANKNSTVTLDCPLNRTHKLEFAGVFHGRELTRKTARLACRIPAIDQLSGGGIARGRISELTGSAGKTSLAAAFAASAIDNGEVAAWLDLEGSWDPPSMMAAGVDPTRVLWASPAAIMEVETADRAVIPEATAIDETAGRRRYQNRRGLRGKPERALVRAAEWLMAVGGFGLVVIDFGALPWPLRPSVALRLARGAEQSAAAVMVLGARRMCGTFAALSLVFDHSRACFSRVGPGAPLVFDGFVADLWVARNKLGGSHGAIAWKLTTDPYPPAPSIEANRPVTMSPAWRPRHRVAIGDRTRA